jgi:hypothetical protein
MARKDIFTNKQLDKMFRLRSGAFNTKAYNQYMRERSRQGSIAKKKK